MLSILPIIEPPLPPPEAPYVLHQDGYAQNPPPPPFPTTAHPCKLDVPPGLPGHPFPPPPPIADTFTFVMPAGTVQVVELVNR